jgi:N-acetylmuramoyl-L-alanine amidase
VDCLWKAPFFFDEELQDYADPATRDYAIEVYDAGYIDITFCYATIFDGTDALEIPEDHPLFSRAEVIANEADYTLRLYLKKPGGFYAWNCYYNEKDQLVFKLLNPVTVTKADNAYGADLTGVRIMIDVGHGGMDTGAGYTAGNGKYYIESERNQYLADLLRAELESVGATVIMNRYSNEETVTRKERTAFLLQQSPDFCICIHHNANTDREKIGFESWYFTNFSYEPAKHIQKTNAETGVYTRSNLAWYYYFVCRQTVCPTVLAENGYMSNYRDMNKIADPEAMEKKAVAIAQGIVNYYLEKSGYPVTYASDSEE